MIAPPALDWQARAVCYLETSDAPELWTPDRRPALVVRTQLERMCQRCPVRRQCAAEAVLTQAQTGMYAGVWVPENSPDNQWAAAMEELRLIAGLPVAVGGVSLGVSA